jgi:pyruvate/2-oxoglutarate dehydrogenase complex dihydrolipoamide acyltransferase (E2) component
MAELAIPKLGVTVTECFLREWLVEDGATVMNGQPIYVLETDKTETEIEAVADGVLRHNVEEGGPYEVGTVVAVIE